MGSVSSGGTAITPLFILRVLLLSFPFCIDGYGLNDIYDYESDKLNPRKGLIEGIKSEPKYYSFVKNVSFFVILLLLLTSFLMSLFQNPPPTFLQ